MKTKKEVLTMEIEVIRETKEKKFDFQKLKRKAEMKVQYGWEWLKENKEMVIILVPIAAAAVKAVGKGRNLHKEEELKERYIYDRSLGHYWKLRRELTNKEYLEIDSRRKNGERMADILNEMRVLD
jgi:hypothetical protein